MKKTSTSVYRAIAVIAFVALFFFGAATLGAGFITKWTFKRTVAVKDEQKTSGAVITESEGNGVSLSMAKIASEEFAEYGVSTLAESAYTLAVVPEPAEAIDKYIWMTTNSTAITLTPSSDTKSCLVECNGSFSQRITITVQSQTNTAIKAECKVDYVKRFKNTTVTVSDNKVGSNKVSFKSSGMTTSTVSFNGTFGEGTVKPDISIDKVYLFCEFADRVNKSVSNDNGTRTATVGGFEYTVADNPLIGTIIAMAEIGDPYSTFVKSTSTGSGGGGAVIVPSSYKICNASSVTPYTPQLPSPPTVAQLTEVFNTSFVKCISGTTADGKVQVWYSYTYKGEEIGSGIAECSVAFANAGVKVGATSLELNNSSIFF